MEGTCTYSTAEEDMSVFSRMGNQWICRTPEEILILIFRLDFDVDDENREKGEEQSAEKETLRRFLDHLCKVSKPRIQLKGKLNYLGPATYCLDETCKRIGISRSRWPKTGLESHQWFISLVEETRHVRVRNEGLQNEFHRAEKSLSDIIERKASSIGRLTRERWTACRPVIR